MMMMIRRPRRAMSFMEIMIVIVILGVLLSVTVPTMQGIHRRNKLSAVAREFSTLARFARHQAILLGHYTEIRINEEMNKYRLYLLPPELNRGVRSSRTEDRTEMERSRFLDAKHDKILFKSVTSAIDNGGRRNRNSVSIIRFYKNGSATPATIIIEDLEKRSMTILIAGATGAVRVRKKSKEGELKDDA